MLQDPFFDTFFKARLQGLFLFFQPMECRPRFAVPAPPFCAQQLPFPGGTTAVFPMKEVRTYWNLADAETFPSRRGCVGLMGLFIHDIEKRER